MSCSSASPRLDTDRPINTPMTARKILIFLFTIPYSPPFRLSKELFQNLLKIDLSNPINKVYSTLYLCGGSSRNNIAATPPQHSPQVMTNPMRQYFHFFRDIACGEIWRQPVNRQPIAIQKTKNTTLKAPKNMTWETFPMSPNLLMKGRQPNSKMPPIRKNHVCVFYRRRRQKKVRAMPLKLIQWLPYPYFPASPRLDRQVHQWQPQEYWYFSSYCLPLFIWFAAKYYNERSFQRTIGRLSI